MPNSKRPSNLNVAFKPLVAALMGLSASTVTALPTLDDASSLVGAVVDKTGNTLNVLQNQQNAVINWKDFSINKNQTVEFKADAGVVNPLVINRVTGNQRSEIMGSLQAEGFRFFLINPNGLVIGKEATVNVGHLVAAATALPSVDAVNEFLNGDSASTLQLMVLDPSVSTELKAGAEIKAQHITLIGQTISNEATLNAGKVQLFGQNIENTSSITATAEVTLHNARELTASHEDGLLVFQVSEGFENALVRHLGTIDLPGGTVSMIAGRNSGSGLSVLNTSGLVNASSLKVQGDTVALVANSPGVSNIQVLDSGSVQVQADQSLVLSGQAQSMGITLAEGASTISVSNTGSVALSAAELSTVNVEAGSFSLDAVAVTGLTNLKVTGQAALRTQGDMKVSSEQTLNLQFEGENLHVTAPTLNMGQTRANGTVTLNVSGDSTIKSQADLNLAGSTSRLDATAAGQAITIGELLVAGDVALNAANITQTEIVNWVGNVKLAGGSAVLDNAGNSISGPVALQLDGDATLVNSLDVPLLLAGKVGGNLTTTSTGLGQTGSLTVGKDATFTTPTITLQDANNQFGGDVTVVGASSVPISAASDIRLFADDASDINIQGAKVTLGSTAPELESLTVVADELAQLQALHVTGNTQLNVDKATLNNTGNQFVGHIQANSRTAQGTATLNVSNSAATQLKGGEVSLSGNLQQGLVADVEHLTLDALTVAGTSQVSANSLKAGTGPSKFDGLLTLGVADQAQVNSAENLLLTGKAGSIDLTSAKAVSATNLQVTDGGQITAESVAIDVAIDPDADNPDVNTLNGLLTVNAGSLKVVNSTALNLAFKGDTAHIFAPELALTTSKAGSQVNLNVDGNSTVNHQENLTLTGSTQALIVTGRGELTLATLVSEATADTDAIVLAGFDSENTSSLKAQTITQIDGTALAGRESLNLQNGINLQADNIALALGGNSIAGDITVNPLNAGAAKLELNNSVNTHLKGGAVALSGTLNGLQAEVTSLEIGPLAVEGAAFVKADSLSTSKEADSKEVSFSEGLNLDVANTAQLAVNGDLTLRGQAGSLLVDEANTLALENLTVEQATTLNAASIDFNQFTGQGDVKATAETISQTGVVNLKSGGELTAQNVQLANGGNIINGVLQVKAGTASLANSTKLDMTFDGGTATISAPELVLSNVSATGPVNLQNVGKADVTNNSELILTGSATTLNVSGNNEITLATKVGTATVDTNAIVLAGFDSDNTSSLKAQTIAQIDGVALAGRAGVRAAAGLDVAADKLQLTQTGNQIGGVLAVNSLTAGQAAQVELNNTVQTTLQGQQIQLSGLLQNGLNADVQVLEIGPLAVDGVAVIKANELSTSQQAGGQQINFSEGLQLDVANTAQLAVNGDLTLRGQAGSLLVDEANTLALENLTVEQATTLNAVSIGFNQFTSQGDVKATAESISQTGVVNLNSGGELTAQNVQLANGGNIINGVLQVKAGTASLANSTKLDMTFDGGTATISAPELVLSSVSATGPVNLQNVGQANITNSGNLTLAGTVGNLVSSGSGNVTLGTSVATADVQASSIILNGYASTGASKFTASSIGQTSNAAVGGALDLQGGTVDLAASGNNFNGVVTLANTGNVALSSNNLNVQGSVGGNANLSGATISQSGALNVGGTTTAAGNTIVLDNSSNQLGSALVLNNAQLARIRNSGNLVVSGQQLNTLDFTAPAVVLGDLGQIQQIEVNTGELSQTAALNVLGNARFRTNQITLDNPDNQFGGEFEVLPTAGEINESGEFVDPPIFTMLSVASSKDLKLSGNNIELSATVKGALDVQANNLLLADLDVQGPINAVAQGTVVQTQALTLGRARIEGSEITLDNAANDFTDVLTLARASLSTVRDINDLQLDVNQVNGAVQVQTGGNAQVIGSTLTLKNTQIQGDADIRADRIAQDGALMVGGQAEIRAAEQIDLQNTGNVFAGEVLLVGNDVRLHDSTDLVVANMFSRGGQLSSTGQIELKGDVLQDGGEMRFIAQGKAEPLSRERLAELLSDGLDVYSAKEAVDPITGQIVLTIAAPAIVQTGGQIVTTQGSVTFMQSTEGASIFLNQNNRITGQLNALAGAQRGQAFAFDPTKGSSLVSVRNTTGLLVGAPGLEADMVAIQARGLATAPGGVIRARMPYNNLGVGAARSYPGLLLSIPVNRDNLAGGGAVLPFGSGNLGGGIQVEIGPQDNPALGGFVSVIPFEGRSLLPGQIVFLEGPVNSGAYRFFYDGARDLGRIPISFNGSILLSPQESSALSTVLGIAVSAREQQTQSVVRTENVERKVFNGVIAEAGPGRPATEGDGELSKPDNCEPEEGGLACAK